MCRNDRRCTPTEHSKSLEAARKRIYRARAALSSPSISERKKQNAQARLKRALETYKELKPSPTTPGDSLPHFTDAGKEGSAKLTRQIFTFDDPDLEEEIRENQDFTDHWGVDDHGNTVDFHTPSKVIADWLIENAPHPDDIMPPAGALSKEAKIRVNADLLHAFLPISIDKLSSWGGDEGDNARRKRQLITRMINEWALGYSRFEDGSFRGKGKLDGPGAIQDATERFIENGYKLCEFKEGEPHQYSYDVFVAAQYEATQKYFKDQGITELTVYRGFTWSKQYQIHPDRKVSPPPAWALTLNGTPEEREIDMSPASSFSLSPKIAGYFSETEDTPSQLGTVISGTIPVERILSHPRTGMGCLFEQEVVVLKGEGTWKVEGNEDDWPNFDRLAKENEWEFNND